MPSIGLYFGSFNPPHVGHTIVAQHMRDALGVDEVWMVVSPHSPFKEKNGLLDEKARFNLVRLAVKGIPGLKVSDIEFSLPQPSYTIDTLRHLRETHPDTDFHLIMGSDNILGIHKWKESEELLSEYRLAVYPRPGYGVTEKVKSMLPKTVQFVDAPTMNLSSTEVRRRVANNEGWEAMVRPRVAEHIIESGFYSK